MSTFQERLNELLAVRGEDFTNTVQLNPDASTREYFRIDWDGGSAIACVYPEAFMAAEQTYLDVTDLFRSNGLPVADVLDFDESLGIIIQEDLGDLVLRDVLISSSEAEGNKLVDDAIRLIARIQSATANAIETGSIASKLKFDTEKLLWELDFFRTHYFETLKKQPLSAAENEALELEFRELSEELESRASVLCHRDFHVANLMIDHAGRLRIIDHQDARIGSPTYDLVSLLLDRITELPSPDWLTEKRTLLLDARIELGLAAIPEDDFAYEFQLQTIQRCLKAVGTFSYQSVNRGKTYFLPFIEPMFKTVLRAARNLGRFPALRDILGAQVRR